MPLARPLLRSLRSLRSVPAAAVLPLAAAALLAVGTAAPASAADHRAKVRTALLSSTAAVRDLGAPPAPSTVQVQVALDLQDQSAAAALATAVSTPTSSQYRQPVAPADWIADYSPTQDQLDEVEGALEAQGLTIDSAPASRLFVLATGTANQVDELFATRLHTWSVNGERQVAAASAASLPATAAAHVASVAFDHPLITSRSARPAASTSSGACSATWGAHRIAGPSAYGSKSMPTPICGYSATQLRATSGVTGSAATAGAGQTVAVLDAFGSATMRTDLSAYSQKNGLPAASYAQQLPAEPQASNGCEPADWRAEQSMDLEAVHAVAPAANLLYVGAADCGYGFDTAMSSILDTGSASIVSNSWGFTEPPSAEVDGSADDPTSVAVHQQLQAAGEGIGLYFASGDDGDEKALDGAKSVDFPASSPWVTAVGGVSQGLDVKRRTVFTTAWGESVATGSTKAWKGSLPGAFFGGGGGGLSADFVRPAYQHSIGVSGTTRGRSGSPTAGTP